MSTADLSSPSRAARPFTRARLGLAALAAFTAACSAGSDRTETVTGPVATSPAATTPAPSQPSGGTARITFWTSDPSPSPIAVSMNGAQVGVLTAYYVSAPACGTQTGSGTITVSAAPGTHTVSARETQANGTWGPSSVTLAAGQCRLYELTP
jgi:hypothetical protein